MPRGSKIIGLGPGDPELITRRAWEVIMSSGEVYLRTGHHPAVSNLPESPMVHTFDHYYQALPDFEAVYQAIVEKVFELALRSEGVIYAVPGDPMVGEATVQELRARCEKAGLPCEVVHGVSFVEPCLAHMGVDALEGLFIADALELAARHHPSFPPDAPALIGQLYSRMVAADVKLTLMNQYPDQHMVSLIHLAGSQEAQIEELRLFEIDRSQNIGSMTALWVPPLDRASAFESFQETVAHLRAPEGCPWDKGQTHQTLRQNLLEEAYEALQAIDARDYAALWEELGDLLLQIVLHAQIALEAGEFSMAEVIAGIQEKILRRHPHVFGDLAVEGVGEVLHNWEALKAEEREAQGEAKGILEGVPSILPALAQANEVQLRVARVGFDWRDIQGVIDKVREELQEVQEASQHEEQFGEIGDLLFAVVNYARWLRVDPESSLRQAVRRFRRRFAQVESEARTSGRQLGELALDELDRLWEASKGQEGRS